MTFWTESYTDTGKESYVMTEARPIRLGIVGLGRAGWGMHCKELEGREEKFAIVAAFDVIEERRTRMAERYGCKTYERIEDLVADPDVEMVDIATRSVDHFRHAKAALEAGKDVFLEKPMTATYEEADALRALAAELNGHLYIRHNRRFEPGFRHVRESIDSGILGEVYEIKLCRVSYQRRDDWQTLRKFAGGQLLNWGPHIIDHALCLLDAPLSELWTDLKRVAAVGDAEDHLKLIFKGENGRIVDLEISGGVALPQPEYTVWGTKGALVLQGNTIQLKYLDPEVELVSREANPGTPGTTFGSGEELPWCEETLEVSPAEPVAMDMIWDALYSAVRQGQPFPITLDQAVEVMRVVSCAKEGTPFED